MKDGRISGYFDTKYVNVLWIEHILYNFEDQKIANFFNLEQVNFRVAFVLKERQVGSHHEVASILFASSVFIILSFFS